MQSPGMTSWIRYRHLLFFHHSPRSHRPHVDPTDQYHSYHDFRFTVQPWYWVISRDGVEYPSQDPHLSAPPSFALATPTSYAVPQNNARARTVRSRPNFFMPRSKHATGWHRETIPFLPYSSNATSPMRNIFPPRTFST